MSRYYHSHAGILQYISREFRNAAETEPDGNRFSTYATVLDRIADDLIYGVHEAEQRAVGGGGAD